VQEVLALLTALHGTPVHITVEVLAENAEGFEEDVVRVVMENARALRFIGRHVSP